MGNIQVVHRADVVEAFRRNDEKVLRAVYQEVFPRVRSYVVANSGDETNAKDVFQDAFLACWQNVKDDKFDGSGKLQAYLFTIAKNKWKDYLRSARFKKTIQKDVVQVTAAATDADEDMEHEIREEERLMQLALERLGHVCKDLLKLFYFERKRWEEIAGQLGITSASARNKKYRCMEQLRNLAIAIKNDQ